MINHACPKETSRYHVILAIRHIPCGALVGSVVLLDSPVDSCNPILRCKNCPKRKIKRPRHTFATSLSHTEGILRTDKEIDVEQGVGFSLISKLVGREANSKDEGLDDRILVMLKPTYTTHQRNASLHCRGLSIIERHRKLFSNKHSMRRSVDHPHGMFKRMDYQPVSNRKSKHVEILHGRTTVYQAILHQ